MRDKKNIIGVIILCVATVISIAFCFFAKDMTQTFTNEKTVQIAVVNGDNVKNFTIKTTGNSLRDAVDEINLVSGEEGQYGLYIKTVNGYTANEDKQEWWCITKNNEPVFEGIDSIKIENDEKYEITLKTGY